jgi:hypothetical protein
MVHFVPGEKYIKTDDFLFFGGDDPTCYPAWIVWSTYLGILNLIGTWLAQTTSTLECQASSKGGKFTRWAQ